MAAAGTLPRRVSRHPSRIATVASHAAPRSSSATSSRRRSVAHAFWQASSIVCAGALTLAETMRSSREA
jgi:hypothetical protein